MIITRTPFRISYAGGGTDFKKYYNKHGGQILSTTIDKYIYVTVNERFDGKINLRYSITETVDEVNDLKHDIVREALKKVGITKGIEIVIISDIPAKGTGLGSSSSLSVGLLNALYSYKGVSHSKETIAKLACDLELNILKAPIGIQDQYAASFGGFNCMYLTRSKIMVRNIFTCRHICEKRVEQLENESMLFHLGIARNSNDILKEHTDNITRSTDVLADIKGLSSQLEGWLCLSDRAIKPYSIINDSWELKKKMSTGYSNTFIDRLIKKVRAINKDVGVKLVGAGGGGFMLIVCPAIYHKKVKTTMKQFHELQFRFSEKGSEVIYNDSVL